jgi:AcrR family transcriptional regulator
MNFNKSEVIPLQTGDTVPTPKRARRADAIANRTLILATAQRLFAKHGVANICMAAIAEAAGVGKGTLYRGFANKGELCHALMDEDMQLFQDEILQLFREKHDQLALTRLDAFLDHLVHFMEFHAPLLREVQNQNALPIDATAQQIAAQMWLPWLRTTIGMLLQQAEQNGEARDLDIPYLVDAILAPLNARLFIYQREMLGFDLERISHGLRRLVLTGCQEQHKSRS